MPASSPIYLMIRVFSTYARGPGFIQGIFALLPEFGNENIGALE
jgi:hypothetical protein